VPLANLPRLAVGAYLGRKDGRSPTTVFTILTRKSQAQLGKAIETYLFRPTYAGANVGHPSYSYGVLLALLFRPKRLRGIDLGDAQRGQKACHPGDRYQQ
jgi:hypothetical protein